LAKALLHLKPGNKSWDKLEEEKTITNHNKSNTEEGLNHPNSYFALRHMLPCNRLLRAPLPPYDDDDDDDESIM
jgi:hypothetical protein